MSKSAQGESESDSEGDDDGDSDLERARDRAQRVLKSHAVQLSEHFDTVMIFCTKHESDETGTHSFRRGVGNWFARYGQVKEWVTQEEESARSSMRGDSQ